MGGRLIGSDQPRLMARPGRAMKFVRVEPAEVPSGARKAAKNRMVQS